MDKRVSDLLFFCSSSFPFVQCLISKRPGPSMSCVCPLVAAGDFPRGGTGTISRVSATCRASRALSVNVCLSGVGSRLANHWLVHLNSALLGFPLVDVMNDVDHWIRRQYEPPYISHPVIIWPHVLEPQKPIHCEWAEGMQCRASWCLSLQSSTRKDLKSDSKLHPDSLPY